MHFITHLGKFQPTFRVAHFTIYAVDSKISIIGVGLSVLGLHIALQWADNAGDAWQAGPHVPWRG